MLRLAVDENFNSIILKELLKQKPALDIVRVQDVGLAGADDPNILEWAAQEQRILLTHDKRTMPKYAYERLRDNQPMAGVLVVSQDMSISNTVEGIILQIEGNLSDEWENQVLYVPF